jgi:hypothetical protein
MQLVVEGSLVCDLFQPLNRLGKAGMSCSIPFRLRQTIHRSGMLPPFSLLLLPIITIIFKLCFDTSREV